MPASDPSWGTAAAAARLDDLEVEMARAMFPVGSADRSANAVEVRAVESIVEVNEWRSERAGG